MLCVILGMRLGILGAIVFAINKWLLVLTLCPLARLFPGLRRGDERFTGASNA